MTNQIQKSFNEGNVVIFKDLGIYSIDPKKDQKINQSLKKFLASLGYQLPQIRIMK